MKNIFRGIHEMNHHTKLKFEIELLKHKMSQLEESITMKEQKLDDEKRLLLNTKNQIQELELDLECKKVSY